MMKTLIAVLLITTLTGCASLSNMLVEERKTASSGFIGCPSDAIQISDGTDYTWTATCKARVFYCTVAPSASCKEAITGKT